MMFKVALNCALTWTQAAFLVSAVTLLTARLSSGTVFKMQQGKNTYLY